jgi:hypothetical protein
MKKIFKIKLEDNGQDFLELDVLENGVLLGYSPMFMNNRLSMIGIGSLDGMEYLSFEQLKKEGKPSKGTSIYLKKTGEKDPLPWKTDTLKHKVLSFKKL